MLSQLVISAFGLIPVYGLGTHADGRPYYAMRFIRGNPAQDRYPTPRAPTDDIERWMADEPASA